MKPGSIFSISLSLDCEACKIRISFGQTKLNLKQEWAALYIKWEESEVHVAGDRRLCEQGHVHQHRSILLQWRQQFRTKVDVLEDLDGGHVEEGGAVEDALLLLLLQVVQDDAGHPHLVQQPRIHVPKMQTEMQHRLYY